MAKSSSAAAPRPFASPLDPLADSVNARLHKQGVQLTLGGEPTLVPDQPEGTEWNFVAVGPTKLNYAYALAAKIIDKYLPGAITVFSPGKQYPGEVNPRWVVNLLANRDGSLIAPPATGASGATMSVQACKTAFELLQKKAARALGLKGNPWTAAIDPRNAKSLVAVLPLDHEKKRWITQRWKVSGRRKSLLLIDAEGSAGLRLPLSELPAKALRRALTLELRDNVLHVFMPPLLQPAFRELLARLHDPLANSRLGTVRFEGYLPQDEARCWTRVGLTADPGVLEINIPPCETWQEYHRWLMILEETGRECGLRSWKENPQGNASGTGGGNHVLFGGPTLEKNPFFHRPAWVASLLRYFQAHPSLAYLFTGIYVGASSQAPRPDESARDLYDLDLGYEYLATLPAGEDHRYLIGETLRHLHTDITGNTHRSEISFDKFWNVGGPAGATSGLIEFRAIESLPQAEWMSLVTLLWQALAAYTLEHPTSRALAVYGSQLHDRFFLPTPLWYDLKAILDDLRKAGLIFPEDKFREIWNWRFPLLLDAELPGNATLQVRRACEGWPLLSETPSEGGLTSRFVDTSIERLEFFCAGGPVGAFRIFVNGRQIQLTTGKAGAIAGLRYRRTALYPSLHPGIKPHLPLEISITRARKLDVVAAFHLEETSKVFAAMPPQAVTHRPDLKRPTVKSDAALLAYDLRLD